MNVRQIMHPRVARIAPDAPVAELIKMLVAESISGVPVVNSDAGVVGTVSVRDVLALIDATLRNGSVQPVETVLATVPVRDIMTPDVITVPPETSVVELASLLRRAGLHRAFVMDRSRLCGVVSTYDVLRAASRVG